MPTAMAGMPKTTDAPRQPTAAMSGTPISATTTRADVAAGDVGADREAAPLGRELLGEQAVADRVLRRAADARRDVRDGERDEAGGQGLGREPAPNRIPPIAEQPAARHDPGQPRVAQLDHPGKERPDGGEEGDRLRR